MKCEVCGSEAHPSWKAHVFATNATNRAATNAHAKDNEVTRKVLPKVDSAPKQARVPGGVVRTANRRKREAYNAYQRGLMQVRRAIAAGRASLWPREAPGV
jgi:hypothetical protein